MSMQYIHYHQYPFNVFVFINVLFSLATPAPSLPDILSLSSVWLGRGTCFTLILPRGQVLGIASFDLLRKCIPVGFSI